MSKLPPYDASDGLTDTIIEALSKHQHDPTQSILKAHLLIEQFLNDFIRQHLTNPQYIDKAGFRFAQKMRLAQAMYSGLVKRTDVVGDSWELVARLNNVRNDLAHQGFGEMDQAKLHAFLGELRTTAPPPSRTTSDEEDTTANAQEAPTYSDLDIMLAIFCTRVAMMLSADIHYKPLLNESARQAGFPPLTK